MQYIQRTQKLVFTNHFWWLHTAIRKLSGHTKAKIDSNTVLQYIFGFCRIFLISRENFIIFSTTIVTRRECSILQSSKPLIWTSTVCYTSSRLHMRLCYVISFISYSTKIPASKQTYLWSLSDYWLLKQDVFPTSQPFPMAFETFIFWYS